MPPPKAKRDKDQHAKHWCATLNERVGQEIQDRFIGFIKQQKYWSFQDEIGAGGNKHIQAYFGTTERIYGSRLLKLFPGVHVEVARSAGHAYDYCNKEESRAPGGRSERSELRPSAAGNNGGGGDLWRQAYMRIDAGDSIEQLEQQFPSIVLRYRNAIVDAIGRRGRRLDLAAQIAALHSGDGIRTQLAECHILWGPPGTGKTTNNKRRALQLCEQHGLRLYVVKDAKWFQDYQGEEIILLQDISPNRYTQDWFLQLMDGHQVWFPCKGGGAYGDVRYVFMDSNYDPETWFTPPGRKPTLEEQERAQAVLRRCGEGKNVVYVPNPILEQNKKNSSMTAYQKIMGGGLARPKVNTSSSAALRGLRIFSLILLSVAR